MKNKVLISVLLVIIIGVTTGLVVSYMNLRNANNQIIELTNKVNENKDSVSDVKNEGKVEESNSVSDKNFALDNNKDDIKYLLEGQKIKWYRESL